MNKNIFIKAIISLFLVIIFTNIFCSSTSHAIGEIISKGKDFLYAGDSVESKIDTAELHNTSNFIYNVLLAIAIIVAVIVAMILGIQFMAASADEKAKVKEALLPFIVGCIVVFGSFTIWKVLITIGNNAEQGIVTIQSVDEDDVVNQNDDGTLTYEQEYGEDYGDGTIITIPAE